MKGFLNDPFNTGAIVGAATVTLVVIVAALTGCAPHAKVHTHTAKKTTVAKKTWKPGPRCRIIGKAATKNIGVIVERNCMKNGVTTVTMMVLNKAKKGAIAAKDGVTLVTRILGFKPKLAVLFYGNAKGHPFFLCAVIGIAEE